MKKTKQQSKSNLSILIKDIKSLIKFGVLIANVLPVIAGFWLALYFTGSSFLSYQGSFLLVTIGSTLVMAGALIINNWFDIDIDTVMERTKSRPTVTGNFSLKAVLTIGIITTIVGFVLLLFTTIEATIYSFIGWFTYVFLYTMWSKRRYTLNTIIGSVSGAVTPLMGWTVVDSAIHIVPIAMFMILFIWQVPHTFATAMKKCEEYRAAGVPMLPVVYGFLDDEATNGYIHRMFVTIAIFNDFIGDVFCSDCELAKCCLVNYRISRLFYKGRLEMGPLKFPILG